MAENNLVEATAIRKQQVIGEIQKNTEFCCLVWKETGQPGQYTASTRGNVVLIGDKEYTFYISRINSGVYLDVMTNCRRFVTYDSLNYPDVTTLYETIEGIAERRIEQITDAIQNLQSVPPLCGILYTQYPRGGIVVGGTSEDEWVNKGREGGVVAAGHAPYNQEADATGGVALGGEARVNPIIEKPEGGVVIGGSTIPDQIIEVGGGIVLGGSALFENNITVSGGVVVGGTIPEQAIQANITGSGGLVINQGLYAWYSIAELGVPTDLYSFSDQGIQTEYLYDSTSTLERLAVDVENKRIFYIDSARDIHRSSQLDPSDDVIIGSVSLSYYSNIDYDNRYLAYQDGSDVIVIDDNGITISTFNHPGTLVALAIDGTNEHVYLSLNLGSGSGGYRIRKYDLKTWTQLGDHPSALPVAAPRLALDRKTGILFYGYAGGTEQASPIIRKLTTDFSSDTFFNLGFQGRTADFDPDILNQKLIVWLRDTAEVDGPLWRISTFDYDGSNESIILETGNAGTTQRCWVEANPTNVADVELIKAIQYGGIVCSGEASVSLITNP